MRFLLFTVASLMLFSCSTQKPTGATQAEVLYKEAIKLIDKKRYLLATEKLNQIRSKYPYSYYATHAELLSADILFSQKNFVDAAAAYIAFREFHPKHKRTDYVVYRIADSFYSQLPSTFDRDLSPGKEAIKYYRELINLFPKSKYIVDAQERIDKCEEMLEKKEKYIADFYYKTEVFDSARYRYLAILDKQEKFKRVRDHSMLRVIQSSHTLNDKSACKKYFPKYKALINPDYADQLSSAYNACIN